MTRLDSIPATTPDAGPANNDERRTVDNRVSMVMTPNTSIGGRAPLPMLLLAAGSLAIVVSATALGASGCSGSVDHEDGGGAEDARVRPLDGSIGADSGGRPDAGDDPDAAPADLDGGGMPEPCVPEAGATTTGLICDLLQLAILDSTEAHLTGRAAPLTSTGDCVAIDEVEVIRGGVPIGTLPGSGSFALDDYESDLARGPASGDLASACGPDEPRFDSLELHVRGRMDGGTFEGRCPMPLAGSPWAPGLVLSCHAGLEERPLEGLASVQSSGAMSSHLHARIPHAPGRAVLSIGATARVTPIVDPAGPAAPNEPFDVSGLVSDISEEIDPRHGPVSAVALRASGDVFGDHLCKNWSEWPELSPSVMLVAVTGTTEAGPFRSEILVRRCDRD